MHGLQLQLWLKESKSDSVANIWANQQSGNPFNSVEFTIQTTFWSDVAWHQGALQWKQANWIEWQHAFGGHKGEQRRTRKCRYK